MKLIASQRAFLRAVERPTCSVGVLCAARGSGKTTFGGWLAGRWAAPDGEIVIVSGSINQSRALFGAATEKGVWKRRDNAHDLHAERQLDGAVVRVVSASGKRALGLGAGQRAVIADEPASWESRAGSLMASALKSSVGKREDFRLIVLGTLSPAEAGSWWPELVAAGSHERTYVQVHQADPGAPWDDLRQAIKACPLARTSPHLRAVIRAERDAARRNSQFRREYEAWRLNRLGDPTKEMLVSVDSWLAVEGREVGEADGRPVVGVDLGGSTSLSSAVAIFPSGRLEAIAMTAGIPDLYKQEKNCGLPRGIYAGCLKDGSLIVDAEHRCPRIERLWSAILDRWGCPEVVVLDRFGLPQVRDLTGGSVRLVPRIPQWSSGTEDIGAFRRAVADGPLSVDAGSRRLLRLSLAAAEVVYENGNVKLIHARRSSRDDVAQAAVLAVGEHARQARRPVEVMRVVGVVR